MTTATNGHVHAHPTEPSGPSMPPAPAWRWTSARGAEPSSSTPARATAARRSRSAASRATVAASTPGVHERSTEAGSKLTAIFGSLEAGEYIVWADATTARTTVTVSEAAVTELFLI